MTKKALITGITGQDGSFLAEYLLNLGYEVHGVVRRSSVFNTERIDHIIDRIYRHYGDVTDAASVFNIISSVDPDEIYHLAAQSHVRISFDIPQYTHDSIASGTLSILEACRSLKKERRIYFAASSEMFGNSPPPQNEKTTMLPESPYACSKLCGYNLCHVYRQSYGMFISCGILFNHESNRRGKNFVTKKITQGVARIKYGIQDKLYLGNLEARRDWGYAKEYVEAMHAMLQYDRPEDFVIATGQSHSVQEFCKRAFDRVGLNYTDCIEIKAEYLRPSEVNNLIGDYSKAKQLLNWKPKTTFNELCDLMVDYDLQEVKNG